VGEGSGLLLGGGEGWVKVEGNGVVDAGGYAEFAEMGAERIAALGADDVEVANGTGVGFDGAEGFKTGEGLIVKSGELAAGLVPKGQTREEGIEEAGLEFVQAGVYAFAGGELGAGEAAAVAELPEAFGDGSFVCDDGAAVAEAAKVFRGIETVSDVISEGGERLFVMGEGAVGLAGVLDDGKGRKFGDAADLVGLAVEVDGEESGGTAGDAVAKVLGVDLEGFGVDVGEFGGGAGGGDGDGGERSGESGSKDFLLGAGDVEVAEAKLDGSGTGGDADGVFGAEEVGEGRFKAGDAGAEDVVVALAESVKVGLPGGARFFNGRPEVSY
jgi:hypothetical protein